MLNENSEITIASPVKGLKKNLENSRAVLLISINSENKGGNFASTADMLKSLNFKEVVILVACELQKDTIFGLGLVDTIEEARKIAIERGDQWVREHEAYLKGFTIIRWHEFLDKEQYKILKNETDSLFIENKIIKNSLKKTSEEFLARYRNIENLYIDESKLLQHSSNYIKNESPIIPYFIVKKFDYILYNNSPNHTFQSLLEFYKENQGHINWLRFDFSQRKISSLKMNVLQNKKHGFSCGRDELEKIIKNRNSNIFFFKNTEKDLKTYERDIKVDLLLKNVSQQVNMLIDTIEILPTEARDFAYKIVDERLASTFTDRKNLKLN